ncbi:MAG: PQQ-binding-like beta-propeller repeat protein [Bacteroidales bacterium]|nr:PQQ-binding-like beta-propeller repeat protein [Candidatus Cacconaster merdequi]
MKKTLITLALLLGFVSLGAQTSPIRFAYTSDVHLCTDSPRIGNLELCIEDINNHPDIQFTMFGGDITEFGADHEIALAKGIIDQLKNPYYIIAGNHDAKWSESGCNTFKQVFGYEQFEFEAGGIKFLGCNSGPNMRMAPALLPHESLVWLDSIAKAIPAEQPVIFVNHFPQDTSMLNYFQVLNTLKKCNIQLIIGGHWHSNNILNYDGVPGILGRSPDRGKEIGYNIIDIADGVFSIHERILADKEGKPVSEDRAPWFTMNLTDTPQFQPDVPSDGNEYGLPDNYPFIKFDVNAQYPEVRSIWRHQDEGDIGDGAVICRKYAVYANTAGVIKVLNAKTGEQKWSYATEGKVFSTPAVGHRRVVIGSSDGYIYCFRLRNGKLLWKHKCEKSVLATPVIMKRTVYCGSSDHIFRALKLRNGKSVWEFDGVKGFVETKPYIDAEQIVFGDWANSLYSLNPKTGELQWEWNTKGSRMYSPAATYPVKANGMIFIVTPERKTYAIDAKTGEQIWCQAGGRESIALSCDASRIFVKNMHGKMHAFSTDAEPKELWCTDVEGQGYEIAPTSCATAVVDGKEVIFMPTDKGNLFCLDASDGSIIWIHKISVALINSIVTLPDRQLLVSTMDGVVTRLEY